MSDFPVSSLYEKNGPNRYAEYATPEHRSGALTFVRQAMADHPNVEGSGIYDVAWMRLHMALQRDPNPDEAALLAWAVNEALDQRGQNGETV